MCLKNMSITCQLNLKCCGSDLRSGSQDLNLLLMIVTSRSQIRVQSALKNDRKNPKLIIFEIFLIYQTDFLTRTNFPCNIDRQREIQTDRKTKNKLTNTQQETGIKRKDITLEKEYYMSKCTQTIFNKHFLFSARCLWILEGFSIQILTLAVSENLLIEDLYF